MALHPLHRIVDIDPLGDAPILAVIRFALYLLVSEAEPAAALKLVAHGKTHMTVQWSGTVLVHCGDHVAHHHGRIVYLAVRVHYGGAVRLLCNSEIFASALFIHALWLLAGIEDLSPDRTISHKNSRNACLGIDQRKVFARAAPVTADLMSAKRPLLRRVRSAVCGGAAMQGYTGHAAVDACGGFQGVCDFVYL